jgi:hypothetical protein
MHYQAGAVAFLCHLFAGVGGCGMLLATAGRHVAQIGQLSRHGTL